MLKITIETDEEGVVANLIDYTKLLKEVDRAEKTALFQEVKNAIVALVQATLKNKEES